MDVIGVFWDIENCAVPSGKSAAKVAAKIRELPVYKGKSEMEFLVVCDVTKASEEVIDDLSAAQINLQHVVAAKKKNAADEKLRQAMRRFVDSHSIENRKTTIILISGDVDFVSDLSDFKLRKGVYVVLLHNRVASDVLLSAANESYDFFTLMSTVPYATSSSVRTPFKFTELLVSNIPSLQEMSRIDTEKKLEEVARAWHGKVRYVNGQDGTAVLRFENGNKTSRAMKNMQGCMVGRRKIQVDFNRRLYENNRRSSPSPLPPGELVHFESSANHVFNPNHVTNLKITKPQNGGVRKIQSFSESSRDDGSESDLSSEASSSNSGTKRRSNRNRQKRRRRKLQVFPGPSAAIHADSPDDELVEVMEKMGLKEKESVFMAITNICCLKPLGEVKRMLGKLLLANGFQVLSLDLKPVIGSDENEYVASVQLPSSVSGSYFIHLMDGLPFGSGELVVKFQEQPAKSEDSCLSMTMCTSSSGVNKEHFSNILSDPAGEVNQNAICSIHDRRSAAGSSRDFILPSVNVDINFLKSTLERALYQHGPEGIPLASLLECLNAACGPIKIEVVPNLGGIPLEQLIHATEMVEIVENQNHVFYVILQRENYIFQRLSTNNLVSENSDAFEKKVLSLLENVPCHRIEMRKLPEKYKQMFGSSYEAELKEYKTVDGQPYALPKHTFLQIGCNAKALLVPSHKYLRTAFMLAVRKVLAGMESGSRILNIFNESEFAQLFLEKFGKSFWVFNFGMCKLSDLFTAIAHTEQKMLHFNPNGTVELGCPLETFVANSLVLLSGKESYTCSVKAFDEDYVNRFGNYSVPAMSYKSIVGLFKEFQHEFSVIEIPADEKSRKKPTFLLSLSEKRKISRLEQNIVHLLKSVQANAVPLKMLDDLYLQRYNRSLKQDMQFVCNRSLESLVQHFVNFEVMLRQDYLILTNGFFYKSMELKAISILFHFPPKHGMILNSEFARVYKLIFGEKSFLDFDHLTSNLSHNKKVFIEFSDDILGIPEVVVRSCRVAKLLKDVEWETFDQLCEQYEKAFSSSLKQEDIKQIVSAIPEFLKTDSFNKVVSLSEGGRYFNALTISETMVMSALPEIHRPTTKPKSRLAANFKVKM